MTHLTAVVLTYNEAEHIGACLATLAFADRRVVFDSGSTDATPALAAQAGAQVITHPFVNYAAQRNAALEAVRAGTDWVLFVDADERVSDTLAAEMRAAMGQPHVAAWQVPRHNVIFGRITRGAGWYPDYQTRLLRVGAARYDPARAVHEVVLLDGPLGTLQTPLLHLNYRDVAHFAAKQRRYAEVDATMLLAAGERLKPWTLITMPLRHFWWRFVSLRGYRDGLHGLWLSVLMARYEFYKWRSVARLKVKGER